MRLWRFRPHGSDLGSEGDEAVAGFIRAAADGYALPNDATAAVRQRAMRAVAQTRRRGTVTQQRRASLLTAAAISSLALLGAAGLGLGIISFGGAGQAQAEVIQGTLSSRTGTELTLLTPSGPVTVMLDGTTPVVDAAGNIVALDGLLQGRSIRVEGERRNQSLVIRNVTVEDEVSGRVAALAADFVVLETARGLVRIELSPSTRIRDPLTLGAYVEIEIDDDAAEGALIAEDVKLDDDRSGGNDSDRDDDDDDDHDRKDNSGPPRQDE